MFDTKIKSDSKIMFDTKIKSDSKISFETKIKFDPKFGFYTKIKSGSKIGFMLKSVCIQNFELIPDILDHLKPSISGLKPPGRLAACYMENTPISLSTGLRFSTYFFHYYCYRVSDMVHEAFKEMLWIMNSTSNQYELRFANR